MAANITPNDPGWKDLTPEEKMDRRFEAWASTEGIDFVDKQAEELYNERLGIQIDALRMKKTPKRVPVIPNMGAFATAYCGYTHKDLMYDVDKAIDVMNRCTQEFQTDGRIAGGALPARVYDAIDYKLYSWPGHGVADNADGVQFVEAEYMKPEEYDEMIADPDEYWQRKYLPRIFGNLEALAQLPNQPFGASATAAIPMTLASYGLPEVQAALKKAMEAGNEIQDWQKRMGEAGRKLSALGYPGGGGGAARAPFDLIGDSLRGTQGIIFDMYRRPQKLIEAMEALVPSQIKLGIESARFGGSPTVAFALHKGADGFMSDDQFKTFYWPTLKKVALGLIEEGIMPRMGAQGGYNDRLEFITDLPKGTVLWAFGAETNMARAKEIVGSKYCMTGNIPASIFTAATPADVEAHVKSLIDLAAPGGGYMLATASGVDKSGKLENVKAMIKTAKEYGVYK